MLTSATTVVAFGALTLTAHRGLASFATVVVLVVVAALLFSVGLLPRLLVGLRRYLVPGERGALGRDALP